MSKLMQKVAAGAFLAGAALSSAPASAAVIVGVKSIVITNALNTWIQVAEVDALNSAGTNVSKTAFAVATASAAGGYEVGHTPDYAIDNNYNTNYFDPGSLFHSATDALGTSLTITFNSVQDLTSLGITGRSDCCSDRDIFNVALLDINGANLYATTLNATNSDHFASSALPEPTSWAMLLLGFGMIGFAMRKRSNVRTTVSYA